MFNGQENLKQACNLNSFIVSGHKNKSWPSDEENVLLILSIIARVDRRWTFRPLWVSNQVTALSNWCRQDLHFASRPCLVHRIFTNAILANVDTMSHSTKCPPFETHGRAFVFFVISVLVARPVCQAENKGPRFKWEKYQSIMYWGVTSLFFFQGARRGGDGG